MNKKKDQVMAENQIPESPPATSPHHKVRLVENRYSIDDVMMKLEAVQDSLSYKVDSVKQELLGIINTKIGQIEQSYKQELDQIRNDLSHLKVEVTSMQSAASMNPGSAQDNKHLLRDSDRCIIIQGLPFMPTEDLGLKVTSLLTSLGSVSAKINVMACERLNNRGRGPALVKVAFATPEEKISILQEKATLKQSQAFQNVYIRSAKSHAERVQEKNVKTLLKLLPCGSDYRLTGHGILVHKSEMQGSKSQNTENYGIQMNPNASPYNPKSIGNYVNRNSASNMNFSSSSNMNVYPQSYTQASWQAPQHPEAPAIAQSTYITEDADSRVRLSAPSKSSNHMSFSSNQPRSFIARPPNSQNQPSSSSGSSSIPSCAAAHLRQPHSTSQAGPIAPGAAAGMDVHQYRMAFPTSQESKLQTV